MYNLGAYSVADLQALINKVVSIRTSAMSIARAKFSVAADPVVVTIVKMDGTPILDSSGNQITRTIPISNILAIHEYGTPAPETVVQQVQAATGGIGRMLPWLIGAAGVFVLYNLGAFKFIGIAPAGRSGRRGRKK